MATIQARSASQHVRSRPAPQQRVKFTPRPTALNNPQGNRIDSHCRLTRRRIRGVCAAEASASMFPKLA